VLEVGAVVDAGGVSTTTVGSGRRRGLRPAARRAAAAGSRRPADPVAANSLGQGTGDRPAVGDDVGDAGRHSDVVLQHPEVAVLVADQVDAGDVHAYAVGRLEPAAARWKCARGGDHAAGDHAVGRRPGRRRRRRRGRASRPCTRCCTPASMSPGLGLDHPRQDVEREGPFLTADVERDALVEVAGAQRFDACLELDVGEVTERSSETGVRQSRAVVAEHLVVRHAWCVSAEGALHVEERRAS
jgi:hypothetical protein